MTALVTETPPTAADASEVAAVAGVLRQLWPEMPELMADRHARTFVRIATRTYGPADLTGIARLGTLMLVASPEVVPDDTCIELPYGGMFLRKWTAGMDRRPGPGRWENPSWQAGGELYRQHTGPRGFFPGAAKHGECTSCVKEGVLKQAIYRMSDANDTYSRSSLCAMHARKLVGGPVVVPKFSSPEEAQAWLDANGD